MKILLLSLLSVYLWANETVIFGEIPNRYLGDEKSQTSSQGYIHIKDKVIVDMSKSTLANTKSKFSGKTLIIAKTGASYDYLFPGLIDLHNHTKQNNLGVWAEAKGQFKNRFEWRAWQIYTHSVSGNMNPWIGYHNAMNCATFRWSAMQAMVIGTTYLQGPSSCISNFGIHQVENSSSYISNKDSVQAPTDLVIPGDMTYVWDKLRPLIEGGKTYEEAIAQRINESCDIPGVTAKSVLTSKILSVLKNKEALTQACTKGKLHPKFIRYVYWVHPSIAGKLNYVRKGNGAVIAHLSEGRRDDDYNQKEFEIAKMLGFIGPKINYVHGVGIKEADMKIMGKNDMGIIWSVYSNLLLYGQTLDIKAAHDAGVILSLGSDWLPTGSRGILEEVKLAAKYIDKDLEKDGLAKVFTDLELYKMLTENPAKMINHWDIDVAKKEHGIGRLAVGAMGTVLSVAKKDANPFTSLVRKSFAEDINLIVLDGNPLYGSVENIKQAGQNNYEELPIYYKDLNELATSNKFKVLPEAGATKAKMQAHLEDIAKSVADLKLKNTDLCNFKTKKAFVHQDSFAANKSAGLDAFQEKTGLNLDRFDDFYKLIAVNMLTQSRNRNEPSKGKASFSVLEFPSLYSCNDENYMSRLFNFINPNSNKDEFEENIKNHDELRALQNHKRVPEKMAEDYKN